MQQALKFGPSEMYEMSGQLGRRHSKQSCYKHLLNAMHMLDNGNNREDFTNRAWRATGLRWSVVLQIQCVHTEQGTLHSHRQLAAQALRCGTWRSSSALGPGGSQSHSHASGTPGRPLPACREWLHRPHTALHQQQVLRFSSVCCRQLSGMAAQALCSLAAAPSCWVPMAQSG